MIRILHLSVFNVSLHPWLGDEMAVGEGLEPQNQVPLFPLRHDPRPIHH